MQRNPIPPTTDEPDEVTAGWLFATANALGLSDADLAYVLDVREDTLRKAWKYGNVTIPDGVRVDLEQFIQFTDSCVDVLTERAESVQDPAIVVYQRLRDVPPNHLAATYGVTWWDHVAFSVSRKVPELYLGTLAEVAAAYDYRPDTVDAMHTDPAMIALYSGRDAPVRTRVRAS